MDGREPAEPVASGPLEGLEPAQAGEPEWKLPAPALEEPLSRLPAVPCGKRRQKGL